MVFQVRTLKPKSTHGCGFKYVGLDVLKSPKFYNFWYQFAPKGYIPLNDLTKFGMGSDSQPRAKFIHCHF